MIIPEEWGFKVRYIFIPPKYYKVQVKSVLDKVSEWIDFGLAGTAEFLEMTQQEKEWAVKK